MPVAPQDDAVLHANERLSSMHSVHCGGDHQVQVQRALQHL